MRALPAGITTIAGADDQKFQAAIFYKLGPLAAPIKREYDRRFRLGGRFHGSTYLREICDFHEAAPVAIRKIKDLHHLEINARAIARRCIGSADRVRAILSAGDLEIPAGDDPPMLARAADWQYWRRYLRKQVSRYRDQLMRKAGLVHKRKMVYCADQTVTWQAQRQASNLAVLERMIASSDLGAEISLAELHAASTANPAIRRAEIMTRIRGMEDYSDADPRDIQAVFVTLTCPSAYHACHSKTGAVNLKYNGSTPSEANAQLQKVWARTRSKLKRDDIPIYGIRIAEPHHDGTPHWHFLIFVARENRQAFMRIFRHYALLEDGHEKGARNYRIKYQWIDRAKGSATAYVVKYIAKSIDGYNVGEDWFGNQADAAANRIVAWARTWGIRQFQQIGGPSVMVWREYRRIRETAPPAPHDRVWLCASAPDDLKPQWSDFMCFMGGATPGRDQLTKLVRNTRISIITGECSSPTNRYGEILEGSSLPIIGLVRDGVEILTRDQFWTVEKRAKRVPPDNVVVGPWTRVNNCTRDPPMAEVAHLPTENPMLEVLKNFEIIESKLEKILPISLLADITQELQDCHDSMDLALHSSA